MEVDIAKVNKPFSAYPEGTTFTLNESTDSLEKDFLNDLGVSEEEFMEEVMKEHKKYLEKKQKENE